MSVFLLWAIPLGAFAAALTLLWLSGDRHIDERTPGEQSFFSGRWQ